MKTPLFQSKTKTIVLAGFIAGTLDILCAIFILAGGNAEMVLRFIAQGAFGPAAYEGGPEMILWGLLFHYFIAYAFTLTYFLLSVHVAIIIKRPFVSGLLYGIVIWLFMNYIVLPLSQNPPGAFSFENAYKNILILMFAVGLPIALLARKHGQDEAK